MITRSVKGESLDTQTDIAIMISCLSPFIPVFPSHVGLLCLDPYRDTRFTTVRLHSETPGNSSSTGRVGLRLGDLS